MKRKFKRAYIEITDVCNLNCAFCPKTTRKKEFMNEELFVKILEQIQGHTEHVYFHLMGEPLLHPQISRFLDISHESGFKVNLTTNGTLIDKVSDMLLIKPALRLVSFSMHSFEENGNKDSFESYLRGIFDFILKAREKTSVLCSLRLWNLSENGISETGNRMLERIKSEFNCSEYLHASSDSRGIEISDGVYLNFAEQFDWPGLEKEVINEKGFCHGLRDQIGFLVDGTVVPCCLDSEGIIALGNIKSQNFTDIIENSRSKAIYDGFSSRKAVEELCKKCGYRTRFNV